MKFRKHPKRIGYYTLIYKKVGQNDIIDESFIITAQQSDKPVSPYKYGEYAILNADLFKDIDKAEIFFKKTLSKSPDNAFLLGNYAVFVHFYKKQYAKAEKLYEQSIKKYPDDPFTLFNYSLLLLFELKNYDKAEEFLIKAIELEPENIKYRCLLANILFKIRKNFGRAEALCLDIISEDKNNPLWLASYAQLLLLNQRYEEAEKIIDKAFSLNPRDEIKLELWFYRYAHFSFYQAKAEYELNKLISKNIKIKNWGLEQNVMIAIFSGHHHPEKLQEYAKKIENNK